MDEWFNLNASIRRAVDPLALMQRVADQAFAALEGADEVLVGLLVGDGSLGYVCAAGRTAERVGQAIALENSLSGQALREGRTLVAGDTETDPRADREASPQRGIRSMVSVPLIRGNAALGVLSAGSRRPHAFEPREVVLLAALAEFITAVVGAARDFSRVTSRLAGEARAGDLRATDLGDPADEEPRLAGSGLFAPSTPDSEDDRDAAARAWVEQIVAARDFSLVFQPIFDLEDGSMLAAEALVRFSAWGSKTPAAVIALAHRVGLGIELEVAIAQAALAHLAELPPTALLSLNAGSAALASGGITDALLDAPAERVIVELTEQLQVDEHSRHRPHAAGPARRWSTARDRRRRRRVRQPDAHPQGRTRLHQAGRRADLLDRGGPGTTIPGELPDALRHRKRRRDDRRAHRDGL